ncbi:hypothetical protein D3C86_1585660 [compost metagenome]
MPFGHGGSYIGSPTRRMEHQSRSLCISHGARKCSGATAASTRVHVEASGRRPLTQAGWLLRRGHSVSLRKVPQLTTSSRRSWKDTSPWGPSLLPLPSPCRHNTPPQ